MNNNEGLTKITATIDGNDFVFNISDGFFHGALNMFDSHGDLVSYDFQITTAKNGHQAQ